jgi:hypothetical protein
VLPAIKNILTATGGTVGIALGPSREGRPIVGHQFGRGSIKISLLAGCHADEPVGPRLLKRLVSYLSMLDPGSPLLNDYQWWIIPNINPDGADRNRVWYEGRNDVFELASYLRHVVRELPGDDIEFGFPTGPIDSNARPENVAAARWWASAGGPFHLHVSLHGMAFAGGPWFLIEPAWRGRIDQLMTSCADNVAALGYALHDMERNGEKGFERIARGFCTRPNSEAMKRFFIDQGDLATAALFRPSSMETLRSLGGDPLTLVSEMPLFIVPGMGDTVTPTDPIADRWKETLAPHRAALAAGSTDLTDLQTQFGVVPMPIDHQLRLQWAFICAGIDAVSG